jgi:hypothetical protein
MENRAAPRRAMWHRDSRSVQTSAVQSREAPALPSPPAARLRRLAADPSRARGPRVPQRRSRRPDVRAGQGQRNEGRRIAPVAVHTLRIRGGLTFAPLLAVESRVPLVGVVGHRRQ